MHPQCFDGCVGQQLQKFEPFFVEFLVGTQIADFRCRRCSGGTQQHVTLIKAGIIGRIEGTQTFDGTIHPEDVLSGVASQMTGPGFQFPCTGCGRHGQHDCSNIAVNDQYNKKSSAVCWLAEASIHCISSHFGAGGPFVRWHFDF